MDQFLKIVRQQLAEQKLSVKDVAERAGISYPYLYRVLKGEQIPSMTIVERVAGALGISFEISCRKVLH